jgi:anti-sigma regulatory factor (Ser/Thr protein kinase)
VAPFEANFPSQADRIAEVRHDLRAWLERGGVGSEQIYDLLLAVDEACTNAVEHGYRDATGMVGLRAEISGSDLYLTIVDHGSWEPRAEVPDPVRGRGLAIMRALVRDVEITTGDDGTRVAMHAEIASAPTGSETTAGYDRG